MADTSSPSSSARAADTAAMNSRLFGISSDCEDGADGALSFLGEPAKILQTAPVTEQIRTRLIRPTNTIPIPITHTNQLGRAIITSPFRESLEKLVKIEKID